MEIRPINKNEQKYLYIQSIQLQGQTGSIGYLRGDFDRDGNGFFSTWNDLRTQWKTEEFKTELDEVVNALRSDEYGLLKDRSSMIRYAGQYPDSVFQGSCGEEFGFRADTDEHAYLIRCNPMEGDDNFYCFCHVSKWLDQHMERANQGVRFVGADGKDAFRIADGEKIVMTTAWGEMTEHTCRYISECHLEVGNNLFHVNEFAGLMDRNGASYKRKPQQQAEQITERNSEGMKVENQKPVHSQRR